MGGYVEDAPSKAELSYKGNVLYIPFTVSETCTSGDLLTLRLPEPDLAAHPF